MQKRDNDDLLISIVMPVYNAEKYLDRAIKCIVAQTYPHWELILVDDCSTDASLAICNQWAYKDKRIHVIHHDKNMGIARSRTDGIVASGGVYIGFMDNDDLIHPQMYEILVSAASKEYPGIVICDSMRLPDSVDAKIGIVSSEDVVLERPIKEVVYERMFANSEVDWQYLAMWNKIYRADLAKSIQISTYGCEDGAFNCTAVRLSGGIIRVKTIPLHFWVQRTSSVSHKFSSRNVAFLESYHAMADEIAQYEPQCFHSVAVKTFKVLLHTRYNGRKTEYHGDVAELISRRFPDFYKAFLNCKEISLLWKCLLSIFYYCPFTYNLFRAFCG